MGPEGDLGCHGIPWCPAYSTAGVSRVVVVVGNQNADPRGILLRGIGRVGKVVGRAPGEEFERTPCLEPACRCRSALGREWGEGGKEMYPPKGVIEIAWSAGGGGAAAC